MVQSDPWGLSRIEFTYRNASAAPVDIDSVQLSCPLMPCQWEPRVVFPGSLLSVAILTSAPEGMRNQGWIRALDADGRTLAEGTFALRKQVLYGLHCAPRTVRLNRRDLTTDPRFVIDFRFAAPAGSGSPALQISQSPAGIRLEDVGAWRATSEFIRATTATITIGPTCAAENALLEFVATTPTFESKATIDVHIDP